MRTRNQIEQYQVNGAVYTMVLAIACRLMALIAPLVWAIRGHFYIEWSGLRTAAGKRAEGMAAAARGVRKCFVSVRIQAVSTLLLLKRTALQLLPFPN